MTQSVPEATPGSSGIGGSTGNLATRNDRLLLLAIGGYVVILSAFMITGGVSLTPDVILVGIGLALLLRGRAVPYIRDLAPFFGLLLAYELMRGYAGQVRQVVHEADVLALERSLFGGLLPTEALQRALHPATGLDPLAMAGTILYVLHFPLPLAVGLVLWTRRRPAYYDFVAALILLSIAGFTTYLILPVAPPWLAAAHGLIRGPDGMPAISYLKEQGFNDLARLVGLDGRAAYDYAINQVNPNQVAAFPSLHAGYPFLAFLIARRAFGRSGWLVLGYAICVWFAVVYLADHYVVDVIGGVVYASLSYALIVHLPALFRRLAGRPAEPAVGAP